MAFGLVPHPQHVDDLEPYRRHHRLLGLGIALGGLTGSALWGLYLVVGGPGMVESVVGALVLAAVAAAGLLHMTFGADLYERRVARRMLARPKA